MSHQFHLEASKLEYPVLCLMGTGRVRTFADTGVQGMPLLKATFYAPRTCFAIVPGLAEVWLEPQPKFDWPGEIFMTPIVPTLFVGIVKDGRLSVGTGEGLVWSYGKWNP